MSLRATWYKHTLNFKFLAGTSQGTLTQKNSYFIKLSVNEEHDIIGIGEISPLSWLSPEYQDIEKELEKATQYINSTGQLASDFLKTSSSSLRFGFEMALAGLKNQAFYKIFDGPFLNEAKPILINGLIWMGDESFMRKQIEEKLAAGFDTLKMKIGAIDYATEISILKDIRKRYSARDLTLRVDANGAFEPSLAPKILGDLAALEVHSIEQPIKAGQTESMAKLCQTSPIPIALDEELIGLEGDKEEILSFIKPKYIILKPSLHGGFTSCKEWMLVADKLKIKYWMTSALESNIGLNAICQFASAQNIDIPQGLGTGQLYSNNIPSPLQINSGKISYNQELKWELEPINSLFE